MTFMLYGGAEAHRVKTGVVSHDFFQFFGIKPILGRYLSARGGRPRCAAGAAA